MGREHGIRRSTGRRSAIVFAVETSSTRSLRIKMGRTLFTEEREWVDVELNGTRLGTLQLSAPSLREYSITLPGALLRPENVLVFALPDSGGATPRPNKAGARRLGIQVEWMEL